MGPVGGGTRAPVLHALARGEGRDQGVEPQVWDDPRELGIDRLPRRLFYCRAWLRGEGPQHRVLNRLVCLMSKINGAGNEGSRRQCAHAESANGRRGRRIQREEPHVVERRFNATKLIPSCTVVLARSEEHTSELQSRQYLVC